MEDYVSYKQAVKLKELGFDWECNHWYHPLEEDRTKIFYADYYNHNKYNTAVSAPTLAQAQKWLREKGVFLFIEPLVSKSFCVYKYAIDRMETIDRIESNPQFDTYEEALAKGLDEALKLLK